MTIMVSERTAARRPPMLHVPSPAAAISAARAIDLLGARPGDSALVFGAAAAGVHAGLAEGGLAVIGFDPAGPAERAGWDDGWGSVRPLWDPPRHLRADWGYCDGGLAALPPARVHQAIAALAAGVARGAYVRIARGGAPNAMLVDRPAEWWLAALKHHFIHVIVDDGQAVPGFVCSHADCVTAAEARLANIRRNAARPLPWLGHLPARAESLAIAAPGAWLAFGWRAAARRQAEGAALYAIDAAHDWLIGRGVIPDGCIVMSPDPAVVHGIARRRPAIAYFAAAQCDPAVIGALDGLDVTLWQHAVPGAARVLQRCGRADRLTSGGASVAARALDLGHRLGFCRFDLFGLAHGGAAAAACRRLMARGCAIDVFGDGALARFVISTSQKGQPHP